MSRGPGRGRGRPTSRARRDRALAAWSRAIRNYDPCISCATHFLDLTVERR